MYARYSDDKILDIYIYFALMRTQLRILKEKHDLLKCYLGFFHLLIQELMLDHFLCYILLLGMVICSLFDISSIDR